MSLYGIFLGFRLLYKHSCLNILDENHSLCALCENFESMRVVKKLRLWIGVYHSFPLKYIVTNLIIICQRCFVCWGIIVYFIEQLLRLAVGAC